MPDRRAGAKGSYLLDCKDVVRSFCRPSRGSMGLRREASKEA
jgi:hypothetical protein